MVNLDSIQAVVSRINVGTTVHCPLCRKLLKIGGPLKRNRKFEAHEIYETHETRLSPIYISQIINA